MGVEFCQFRQSVQAAKVKQVKIISVDESRFWQMNHDSTKILVISATPQ